MFEWPIGKQAALSLTFDDGRQDQLEIVVPELEKRGLRATFYLNPKGSTDPLAEDYFLNRLSAWQPVAAWGNEMGNHTIQHRCSLNADLGWNRPSNRDMTLDEIAEDMDETQRRLMTAFPHQKHTSFAYPCYESDVGQGKERKSFVPLVTERFIAARGRGEYPNQPCFCDLHYLSSWNVEKKTAAELIALVDRVIESGNWGIFTFHGIGEENLSVLHADFTKLLDYLLIVEDRLWLAPVAEVGRYITQVLSST